MTLEEAMERYGIPLPGDKGEYDKNTYREFDDIYLGCFYETFSSEMTGESEKQNFKKVAVVLGGQIGAGKNSLVAHTKREFHKKGRSLVLIAADNYRKFYPNREEILATCPEFYAKITGTAINNVTPRILKFASDNGYGFIFDATMKNIRVVNTMKTWDLDYEIQVKVLAASRLRSLVSATIRNAEFRRLANDCRYVSVETHDETYYGIPETLKYLEQLRIVSSIKLYVRGVDPISPIEKYSSRQTPEISSADELIRLRELDEKEYLEKYAKKDLEYLENLT